MPSEPGFLLKILEPSAFGASRRRLAPSGSPLSVRLALCVPDTRQLVKISCRLQGPYNYVSTRFFVDKTLGVCSVWFKMYEAVPSYETFTRITDHRVEPPRCEFQGSGSHKL